MTNESNRTRRRHPSPHTVARVLALGVLLAVALAADPVPAGRTYLTVTMGLVGRYAVHAECLEFIGERLCSLDATTCGTWQQGPSRRKKGAMSFELTTTVDGWTMRFDGAGRFDARGAGSSIAGTARGRLADAQLNASFAGREVDRGICPLLAAAFNGPGEPNTDIVGSGRLVTESREIGDLHEVSLLNSGRLVIEHGTHESLSITAEDNILPVLESEVRNGRLTLGILPGYNVETRLDVEYRLTVRDLDGLFLSGSTSTEASGIDTRDLYVDLSGSSKARLAGRVERQTLRLTGSSRYLASELPSRSADVRLSGSSRAVLRVADSLTGSAAGSSRVEYYGDPAVSVTTSQSARVRRIGG